LLFNDNLLHSFRIKAEIKQALQRLAKEDKRSLSAYIELALEANIETMKADDEKGGPGVRPRGTKR
jgi:predicted DNA-binding protein